LRGFGLDEFELVGSTSPKLRLTTFTTSQVVTSFNQEDKTVTIRKWLASAVAAAGLTVGGIAPVSAAETKSAEKIEYTFGSLRTVSVEKARAQAETWLKSTGKFDQAAFEKIWSREDGTVLDRVTDTLTLGSADAAKIMSEASTSDKTAPKQVPALLKDEKQNSFLRANLALAYARSLSGNRVYEEALGALKSVTVEQVADPGSYLFHRAVSEHALMQKKEAIVSVLRLINEVQDAPDRYLALGGMMLNDMLAWKADDKDLGNIGKLMDNVERRLDLSRGGPETQEIQKKILFRLDELIKEKESQCKGGQCNGGNCPNGGQKPGNGGSNPSSPMQDSNIATNSGPGQINEQQLRKMAENWVKMNDKERAEAMAKVTSDLPPKYKVIIEDYFKAITRDR